MELRRINDYNKWRKAVKQLKVPITFIPLRFGKYNAPAIDDRGEFERPTKEELDTYPVNSKPRKR